MNPFAETDYWSHQSAEMLKTVAEGMEAQIDPVTVCPFVPDEDFLKELAGKLEEDFAQLGLPHVAKPQLLDIESPGKPSLRRQAQTILDYAKEIHADLIAVQVYENKKKPVAMGSFAENLCMASDIPVLTLHPDQKNPKDVERILFVTDFSDDSWKVYSQVLGFAKQLEADVDILHWIEHPSVYQYGFYGVYLSFLEDFVNEETKKAEDKMKRFTTLASDLGIEVNPIVKLGKLRTYEGILDEAKDRKTDIIAMVSRTGGLASVLQGSTTAKSFAAHPVRYGPFILNKT